MRDLLSHPSYCPAEYALLHIAAMQRIASDNVKPQFLRRESDKQTNDKQLTND